MSRIPSLHNLTQVCVMLLLVALAIGTPRADSTEPEAPSSSQSDGASQSGDAEGSIYQSGPETPYGIGKYYRGREIARVMSHLGADWLDRPERKIEERPDEMIAALPIDADDVLADIGAGSGYLTFRLSERVPQGTVLAVDIQPEMLEILAKQRDARGIDNVETVLGTLTDPRLPEARVDLALMVDAYHEFSHPHEMMRALYRALRPGGLVALVEYRAEDPEVPILPTHKMSEAQVKKELSALGYRHVRTFGGLPQQHLLLFEKPAKEVQQPTPRAN